ncbi:hypothetical protein OURE66S_00210 [Oligella ureolytica]
MQGVEFEVSGQITDRWRMHAGYSYLDSDIEVGSTVRDDGIFLLMPRHTFNLWSTYDVTPELVVGAGINAMTSIESSNGVRGPGHATIDAMVSYQVTDRLKVQLTEITWRIANTIRVLVLSIPLIFRVKSEPLKQISVIVSKSLLLRLFRSMRIIFSILIAFAPLSAAQTASLLEVRSEPEAVELRFAKENMVKSQATERNYRIQTALFGPEPENGYPVLFILDGDAYFTSVATFAKATAKSGQRRFTVTFSRLL